MNSVKWVDIPNYEDKYQISNLSEIRIKPRDIIDSTGKVVAHIDSKIVDVIEDKTTTKKYAILHDGKKYNKAYIDDIINSVKF